MTEATELAPSNPDVSSEAYTIKVDGVERQVSLQELQSGYQRQADYTRKTQELARERERLSQAETIVQALETDPQGAISALGDAFGVSMGNQMSSIEENEDFEDMDPDESRLRRIESAIEEQNSRVRQNNLQKEMSNIREKYSTDISDSELYAHALKHNIGNLEAAYAHLNYENVAVAATAESQENKIMEDKRAANVVDANPGSSSDSIGKAVSAVSSIREAYEQARQDNFT